ncbi:MAG: hydroxymyristoyl-ACP dehydratase [Deltaproteobacteria bacterium]|nr:hydroxymyristoyl-ACP dehydratase [Deltaproteobacteria bacterium]
MSTTRIASTGDSAAAFLPHTPPFLLLDRIVAIDGPSGRFVKHVTAADPLIGPAGELSPMLLVEAMAQGAGIVLGCQEPELRARGAVLAAIDHCAIAGTAGIGDALEVEITVVRRYAGMARIKARASVGARTCATAALTLAFPRGTSTAAE